MRDKSTGHQTERRELHEIASIVREACVAAALEAYEHAKLSGLCDDGAWEVAVGAMREVDLDRILEESRGQNKH